MKVETAKLCNKLNWWPVIIEAGGKNPTDAGWPDKRYTDSELERRYANNPALNVGVKLGPDSGIIDIEGDGDGWQAALTELFGGEPPRTPSYKSKRGEHRLCKYDPRLAGITTVKLGPLEIRVGSNAAQSLLPPSTTDGFTREWVVRPDECEPATLPDVVIDRILAAAPAKAASGGGGDDLFRLGETEFITLEKSVVGYLENAGFKPIATRRETDATYFDLSYCPRRGPMHRDGRPAVILHRDGGITLKCFHAKCGDESPGDAWRRFQRDRGVTFAEWQTDLAKADEQTDNANARRFAERYGDSIRWDAHANKWLVWDGRRWAYDNCAAEALAKKYADSLWVVVKRLAGTADASALKKIITFIKATNGAQGIGNLLRLARSEPGIAVQREQLNVDPTLVTVLNGTVCLETGVLREHRKADLITKLAPVNFDPNAECPLWLAFLNRIFKSSPAWIAFIQRWLGYCLTGSTREQKLSIAHGCGANGKTTLVEAIMATYGDYAGKAPPKLLALRQHEPHPTEVAYLFGQRAMFITETDERGRLDETLVKHLTGSDTLNARRLYENPWTFKPTHKLTISTNHRPEVVGIDEAIWRRVIYIPFDETIPDAERDRDLLEKLRGESAGIFRWCVEGARQWAASGLALPAEATKALAEYKGDQTGDGVLDEFLASECETGDGKEVPATLLLESYNQFAGEPISGKRLAMLLKGKGFSDKRRKSGKVWLGIALAV